MLKITRVEPLPPTGLRITMSNSKVWEMEIGDYLHAPGHELLQDPAIFADVSVDEWGHAVQWPGDLAIPATALVRMAKEQAGQAFPVQQFNAWMQRHGLSAAAAARALGLTRRTVLYYHTGSKPIPVVVGLACEGYDSRFRRAA